MARCGNLISVVLLAAVVLAALDGAAAVPSRRSLKIVYDFVTHRGWSNYGNLGLGFKYDEYGGSVDLGEFSFKKDEGDFSKPTLFEEEKRGFRPTSLSAIELLSCWCGTLIDLVLLVRWGYSSVLALSDADLLGK
ncbi:hypothetical protein BSKO_02984 [Bryopsis sp. KO-2023]|nr:hypothetical protein BSKO_02984 [Bryopsis sp. KO-2023]